MRAVFDQSFVKRLNGPNVMSGVPRWTTPSGSWRHPRVQGTDRRRRTQMIWCGSTEVYHEAARCTPRSRISSAGCKRTTRRFPQQIYATPRSKAAPATPTIAALDHRHAGAAGTGAQHECAGGGQGLQERPDVYENADRAGLKSRLLASTAGFPPTFWAIATAKCWTSRARSAPRSQQVVGPGVHFARRPVPRPVQALLPQGPHRVLSAARRRQGRLGQHRHLRLARVSMQIKVNFLCRDSILPPR